MRASPRRARTRSTSWSVPGSSRRSGSRHPPGAPPPAARPDASIRPDRRPRTMSRGRSSTRRSGEQRTPRLRRPVPTRQQLRDRNSSRVLLGGEGDDRSAIEAAEPGCPKLWPATQSRTDRRPGIEKAMLMVDISQRPAIRECTSRPASWSDSPSKRSARSAPRPIVLPSIIPDTEQRLPHERGECRPGAPCRRAVIARRSRPTRRISQTNSGTSANENQRQLPAQQRHHDRRRDHRRQRFWAIDVAVLVATLSMRRCSLAIRDCTRPRACA